MVDLLSYFSFQQVFYNWCNKCCGMYCLVRGMVHIKETLLLIRKSSQSSGGSRFTFIILVVLYHIMSDAI